MPPRAVPVRRFAAVLLVLAAGLLVVWSAQRRLIYFPFGAVPPPVEAGLPRAEPITFATEDGLTLGGWFVPSDRSVAGATTALVFNGNGGNRAMRAPLAARLAARGFASLLVDYRGYGGNPGDPSEEGLARDARAARRYLVSRPDVDPARLVYFGESLGSAVAVRLAAEAPPLALVLRSPFTSLVDVGRYHYPFLPVRLLLADRFASIDRIGEVRCPLLVIAAGEDSIVPLRLSERLFEAASEPKRLLVIDGVDHNDAELFGGTRMIEGIVEFITGITGKHRDGIGEGASQGLQGNTGRD